MEEKTKKSLIKTLFIIIGIAYLVLIGPIFLNQNHQLPKNSPSLLTKELITIGASILSIPEKYQNIAPGDELVVEIRLHQFKFGKKTDVILEYEIQDIEGNIILKQHETVAIQTQASFLKTFSLPLSISPGRYTVFCTIKNLNSSFLASTTASFQISKPVTGYQQSQLAWVSPKNIFIGISIIFGFLLLFLFLIIPKQKLKEKETFIQRKPQYNDLIEAIIKHNVFFGKTKAIALANRIKGLKVSPEGRVVKLKEEGLETMINLIDLYRISIGQSSIKIAREAIRDLVTLNPRLVVPSELKTT